MQRVLAKLRAVHRRAQRSDRASILVPLLIVSIGLGVLTLRSYVLSARMERGVETLAMQYAGYSADITARRTDAALRTELTTAAEEWQQTERRGRGNAVALQRWVENHDWMVSAIFVPDADPARSVFTGTTRTAATVQVRDFYTSTGLVRYTYDPERLLKHANAVLRDKPLMMNARIRELQPQAELTLVPTPPVTGSLKTTDGYAFTAPLAPPLAPYAVRSVVHIGFAPTGWENARTISVVISLIATVLTAIGALLALRGVKREAEAKTLRAALV
ncbi:MAG TPA: hypothetical protein VLU46_00120, partial [Thermoanaerobaculia bacterium]|nr:hypothetical protein [Thermoanaerobaculia bacterium]